MQVQSGGPINALEIVSFNELKIKEINSLRPDKIEPYIWSEGIPEKIAKLSATELRLLLDDSFYALLHPLLGWELNISQGEFDASYSLSQAVGRTACFLEIYSSEEKEKIFTALKVFAEYNTDLSDNLREIRSESAFKMHFAIIDEYLK